MTNNNFAINLSRLRQERNITKIELAEAVGLTRQAISNYERGNTEPNLSMLINFSLFFNVSIDALVFTGTDVDMSKLRVIEKIERTDTLLEKILNDDSTLDVLRTKKGKLEYFSEQIPRRLVEINEVISIIENKKTEE